MCTFWSSRCACRVKPRRLPGGGKKKKNILGGPEEGGPAESSGGGGREGSPEGKEPGSTRQRLLFRASGISACGS